MEELLTCLICNQRSVTIMILGHGLRRVSVTDEKGRMLVMREETTVVKALQECAVMLMDHGHTRLSHNPH